MEKTWCWEGLGAGGKGDDRGWDGWMASLTRWTWVWENSGSWWWTGRPGVLQFMGSQRVGHDWALNWTEPLEPYSTWLPALRSSWVETGMMVKWKHVASVESDRYIWKVEPRGSPEWLDMVCRSKRGTNTDLASQGLLLLMCRGLSFYHPLFKQPSRFICLPASCKTTLADAQDTRSWQPTGYSLEHPSITTPNSTPINWVVCLLRLTDFIQKSYFHGIFNNRLSIM